MNENDLLACLEESEETNDKWLIPESKLDSTQLNILSSDGDMLIEGGAGSGKTILAIYKLARIIKENSGSYAFIVYTTSLKKFIETGIEQIQNEEYRNDELNQLKVFYKYEVVKLIRNKQFNKVDYIIIDEVQDLDAKFIKLIREYAKKNIIVLGDDRQQIYSSNNNDIKMSEIAEILDIENRKELYYNYRTPKSIARFAGRIIEDGGDLENRCVKDFGDEPKLTKYNSYEEEIKSIINFIEEESVTDVAILLPINEDVKRVKDYISGNRPDFDVEYKYKDEEEMHSDLEFNSLLPKVMTYYSAKGLEFDYVFLPMCEENDIPYNFKNALYVACTRAKKSLFISYNNKLNKYIK